MKAALLRNTACAMVGLAFGATAQAASVQLTADGDSYLDADFFTLSYSTGAGESINLSSVIIDLAPLSATAVFDFDGVFSFACPADLCVDYSAGSVDRSGEGPIFNIGTGVTIGDVDFNYDPLTDPQRPTSLDISLAAFVGGDSFSFGANTDGTATGDDFLTGDLLAGAQFTAFFSDGSSASAFLANTCGPQCSTGIASTVIPVPAAVWLFGSGLLGLAGVARRHKRSA